MPRSLRSLEKPGSAEANSALFRWGVEYRKNAEASAKLKQRLRKIGFGVFTDGISYAPLDLIGDFMRDIKNVLLDCYRQSDKVKTAAESVMGLIVEMARISAKSSPPDTIHFIPLHLNEYFSPKQYSEFYWPTLKGVINELIKLGITPRYSTRDNTNPTSKQSLSYLKARQSAASRKPTWRRPSTSSATTPASWEALQDPIPHHTDEGRSIREAALRGCKARGRIHTQPSCTHTPLIEAREREGPNGSRGKIWGLLAARTLTLYNEIYRHMQRIMRMNY